MPSSPLATGFLYTYSYMKSVNSSTAAAMPSDMRSSSALLRTTSVTMAFILSLLRVPMRSRTICGSSPGSSRPARSASSRSWFM